MSLIQPKVKTGPQVASFWAAKGNFYAAKVVHFFAAISTGSRQVKAETFTTAKSIAVTSDRMIARENPELAKVSANHDAVAQGTCRQRK